MSRYASEYTQSELYDAMAEIAREANPAQPDRCTQRAFDDARARAGHPNCPSARQICTRLNAERITSKRTWRGWLDVTLNKNAAFRVRSAAKRGTVKQSPETIRQNAAFSLRLAHAEGDHHRSRDVYRAWREKHVATMSPRVRPAVPTEEQILRAFGSWRAALETIELPLGNTREDSTR